MRLIDADALIEKLEAWKKEAERRNANINYTFASAIIAQVNAEPTVEERKWIPCSERLPEDLEEVNITWVNHNPEPYYDFVKDKPFTATAVYYKEKWYWYTSTCVDLLAEYGRNPNQEIDDDIEIIAWMPLPEPYEERREE